MVFSQVPKAIGFIYALVMVGVIAYLWYSGRWRQKIAWLLLVISVALGFLIFSPVLPWQFQQLVLGDVEGLGGPLIVGVIGLAIFLLITFGFGRFFCGYICPVGTIQEIASHAPVPKVSLRPKKVFMGIRAVFFVLFLVMAFVFSASLLALFGIQDFFYLSVTAGTFVFIIILLLSLTLYRPFCRIICPYAVLLSLGAWKAAFRIHRTSSCIECKKCEKACPTDEAKRDDGKAECYLCGRCGEVCPVAGALVYNRRDIDGKR